MTRPGLLRRTAVVGSATALTALLTACAPFPALHVAPTEPASLKQAANGKARTALGAVQAPLAPADQPLAAPATPEQIDALLPPDPVDVELPPQPLPQLVNTVFGEILHVPYFLGPDVASRREIVAIRGVHDMTKRDFFRLTQAALRDYGVRLSIKDGTVAVMSDEAAGKAAPVFLRARSSPEVPEAARPVVQFYPARSVDAGALLGLLSDVFPDRNRLKFSVEARSNSLMVEGSENDVAAVLELVRDLDQPRFAGAQALRIEPVFWPTEGFARALRDALTADGVFVARDPAAVSGISVLAFPASNQVLVFARNGEVLTRARERAEKLDQPAALGERTSTFVYRVQNTDAQSLADLVGQSENNPRQQQITGLAGTPPAATAALNAVPAPPPVSVGAAGVQPAVHSPPSPGTGAIAFGTGRVIVDARGNRILFTGPATEFAQLRGLLSTLDVAPRQVLVEVTVAEVTLDDETRAGLEWFFTQSLGHGTLSGGTLGGLGLSQGGLSLQFRGTNLTAAFNAFASNNKVNILSRPRLVARSGGDASIQVGTDVPIITSQATGPTQVAGTTGILQTIQYRQTGVILHIKPVVYGDDLVNLEITQEVSSEQNNSNAAIASPLILDRNVTTELSVADGSTAVLGGLISDNYTKANTGIPVVKDIPILGAAFRSDTISGQKTELVMLVTPYILRQPEQIARFTNAYAADMNAAFRVGQGWSYTLTPFTKPMVLTSSGGAASPRP